MKKGVAVMKIILIIGLVICILIFLYLKINVYELDYLGCIGLSRIMPYEKLITKYGEPIKQEENNYYDYYYDGFVLRAYPQKNGDLKIMCVVVTGEQYRFGKYQIGIGSTLDEIINAYNSVGALSGDNLSLDKLNVFNCTDGIYPRNNPDLNNFNMWLGYQFDESGKVVSINIQRGGP